MKELLKTFPVVTKIPVIWGDMDSFKHVNNVIYFRYFESARIQYFETLGWLKIIEKMGIGPILGSTSCRYRIPLTYPDSVFVGAKSAHDSRKLGLGAAYLVTDAVSSKRSERPIE